MPAPLASPDRPSTWSKVVAASERLPNWARAVSILALPFVAFATNAALGTPAVVPLFAVFVALTAFTLWAHLPVLAFDGPLPFSDAGVHVRGEVYPWESVEAIEPGDGRDLAAVLAGGERLRIRVRGARTHEELREVVRRHKAGAVRF